MSPTPALLLVHGAFHGPWAWRQLIEQLPDVDVRTVALPSTGSDTTKLGDLYDDAAAVAAGAADVDGPVVVLGHSYGGHPLTQGLAKAENVERLIYLAAIQLDVGDTPLSAPGGGQQEPWWEVHDGYLTAKDPMKILYADVEPGLARQSVAQLRPHSLVSATQALTEAAWRNHPSTYIICEADIALPTAAQEIMAQRAKRVRRIQSSHSPFLSRPAELAALIREELAS